MADSTESSASYDPDRSLSALLARARAGNPEGTGELLENYRRYMLLLASSKTPKRLQTRLSASDVVQETMLKAHQNFGQFRGHSERELLAWLRQILLSSLANFVEKHVLTVKRDVRREIPLEQFEAPSDGSTVQLQSIFWAEGETPSVSAQRREDAVLLAKRLAKLPPSYREVLVLRNIQGLSFEEVAARMNRSPGSTRVLWLRAIDKLRGVYRKAEEHGE